MEFINELMGEINSMDLNDLIVASLFLIIPFYFSKKAQTHFFRLFYAVVGICMILTMDGERIIIDLKMLVGIGLLLPQLDFLKYFIQDSIRTVKMMTANTYYFFVTIYYKVIRFINWVRAIPFNIKIFFSNFGFRKKSDESDYEEYQSEQHFKQEHFYEEKKSHHSSYEESSYEKKQDNSYQEQSYSYQEEPKQEPKKEYGEFDRFNNSSAYIVIGVSSDDDFATMKKVYRKLVRQYHPDLNPDNIEQATEITQLLNSAYAKLEKYHK